MTPQGVAQLKSDEGCRLTAYPDPLSGGAPWTIGYGQTGFGIAQGTTWTQAQADDALASTLARNRADLTAHIPWWTALTDTPRGDVLENMAYNLGVPGLMGFPHTLAAVESGDYEEASAEMLLSRWADQVGDRAQRLSDVMKDGVYPMEN